MKNLLLLLLVSTASHSLSALASTEPSTKDVSLLNTASISVTVSENAADMFKKATFNGEALVFETMDDINFIQIFNSEGQMEFQLPVMSNKVTIGKSLIANGSYKLGFMIKGQAQIQFTDVTVN